MVDFYADAEVDYEHLFAFLVNYVAVFVLQTFKLNCPAHGLSQQDWLYFFALSNLSKKGFFLPISGTYVTKNSDIFQHLLVEGEYVM